MNSASRGLRPTVGLCRPKSVPCVGGGRRLARGVPNEFGLEGPSADGRPAPTGKVSSASAEADAWRGAPGKADFNWRERPSANGWPTPTEKDILCVGGGRRLARSAWEGRFQSAWRPSADGRPVPTGRGFCVGGGRRVARSALRGRFQSAQKPSADGRPVPTEKRSLRRRRPTRGAQAP
jgi:hypothetical protein